MPFKRHEIAHRLYNLDGRDSLNSLPAEPAVYGVFAVIDDQPVNCRHIGHCGDLRASVRDQFERAVDPGLRTFMQGPWRKMVEYLPMDDADAAECAAAAGEWAVRVRPGCAADGEYAPSGDGTESNDR